MKEALNNLHSSFTVLSGVPLWLLYLAAMLVSCIAVLIIVLLVVMFLTWMERKVSAHMQSRLGPMRSGLWHGWAQPIADGIKLFLKEDIVPALADRTLFILAPCIVFLSVFLGFAAIPFGKGLAASNVNVGLFYILAVTSLTSVGIIMGAWASNNKWSLLGAMRSAAQIVSYEIPVGLSLIPAVMIVGSLGMQDFVNAQSGGIHKWLIFRYPPFMLIAFIIYFIASLAESNRAPFDIPEAESEIVAGFHTEYSSMRFAFFFLAEYAEMLLISCIGVVVFLGGWEGFGFFSKNVISGPAIFITKCMVLVFIQMWFRWTYPRLRVDQLMHLSWKVLLPFSFANMGIVGILILIFKAFTEKL